MQVVVNELLTNYSEYGEKNAKCLLILHGWSGNLTKWDSVAKKLAVSQHVISVDLPGFGTSAHPKTTFSIYDYADFVTAFMQKIGISRFSVLGHSFGGRIGIILGANAPSINKLILVDSAGTETTPHYYKLFLSVAKPLAKIVPKKLVQIVKRKLGSKDYLEAGDMLEIFKKVVNEDLTYLLAKIRVVTLIVWGSEDKVLDVKTTKLLTKKMPNSKVRIVWGAGHQVYQDKEAEFVQTVSEFLTDDIV